MNSFTMVDSWSVFEEPDRKPKDPMHKTPRTKRAKLPVNNRRVRLAIAASRQSTETIYMRHMLQKLRWSLDKLFNGPSPKAVEE